MIPLINYPLITLIQPSSNKPLQFRRYLVKEEKILLLAKESKEIKDIFRAVKQILILCCQEPDFNIEKIPLFDLEYLYLQLRANSVNSSEKINIEDKEDGKKYELMLNFDDIKVNFNENAPDKNIKIDKNLVLVMKYPEASIYNDETLDSLEVKGLSEGIFELVVSCMDKVFKDDELIPMTYEELTEFTDTLDIKTYKKIENFLFTIPSIKYELKYTNSLGNEKVITFSSLIDFFLFL